MEKLRRKTWEQRVQFIYILYECVYIVLYKMTVFIYRQTFLSGMKNVNVEERKVNGINYFFFVARTWDYIQKTKMIKNYAFP